MWFPGITGIIVKQTVNICVAEPLPSGIVRPARESPADLISPAHCCGPRYLPRLRSSLFFIIRLAVVWERTRLKTISPNRYFSGTVPGQIAIPAEPVRYASLWAGRIRSEGMPKSRKKIGLFIFAISGKPRREALTGKKQRLNVS